MGSDTVVNVVKWPKEKEMIRDIFSGITIRDIFDAVGRILVALALGYLKLRLDSERRHRREHQRRVADSLRTCQANHTDKHARSAAAGQSNGVYEDTGDTDSHGSSHTSSRKGRIRET